MRSFVFGLILSTLSAPLWAQGAEMERIPSHCRSLAMGIGASGPEVLWQAGLRAPVEADTLRIHYINHSMFALQAEDVVAVTDFNGFIGSLLDVPDVITMNQGHSTHYTLNPPKEIPHVLRGWGAFGEGVEHDLDLGPMRIRNVSTDLRMGDGREEKGNSIFIFEAAGLCVGHLGHLHGELSDEQYASIGRLDVVMVPVDGGRTMPRATAVEIVSNFRSSVVIPMHWFNDYALEAFLTEVEDAFTVIDMHGPELVLSLNRLPSEPTVMVLRPEFLSE